MSDDWRRGVQWTPDEIAIITRTREKKMNETTRPDRLAAAAGAAGAAERAAGFTAMTANDIGGHIDRILSITEHLNELGGRLIGVDQLPRNQRDTAKAEVSNAPEPVRSDTEKVNFSMKRLTIAIDDLAEIQCFLEQL